MRSALTAIDHGVGLALRAVASFCLAALFAVLFVNVVSRTFVLWSLPWFDEVVEVLFAWMVFIGAAALWREKEHFRVDWLETALGEGTRRDVLRVLLGLLSLAFFGLMVWTGLDLTLRSRAVTPILNIPVAFLYASIPLASFIMFIYSAAHLCRNFCIFFTSSHPSTQETEA
ncbi:TRAP transporter small permease [Chelativorans salis]|uniref:TRAP transporter small permease protein n=1 Tax=Chelativorans salis TaxID=2978478 RepID=A0ABT2LK28_9HYPH|nr:TRAP transporter small permease [Chelativorans sp. EGI FJ00035]MCT7374709.1 TRAP transporter small permease [Chelativorans sp. EGI FJ00035]